MAALNYNENKVKQGKAHCIHVAGYLRTANEMNFYQKLEGFERRNALNERARTKTVHVSLNFDPSENLSVEKLQKIASEYMLRIGFGEQPYLVYQHFDAGHPHIHIVSTTIREDGSRIPTHNIGKNQSEKARKEIEQKFGLVKAQNQKQLPQQKIEKLHIEKLVYGKAETKKGIAAVVNAVTSSYKFASLPEFNAILQQFNVVADRGNENGRIYKNRGLVYRVLDADGNKAGVPIKASDIHGKPCLDKLEKLFAQYQAAKESYRNALKTKVDDALLSGPVSLKEFTERLEAKNIYTVLRKNAEGRLYGITFVDNDAKIVFNGSDLGKSYSAGHLQTKILQNEEVRSKTKVVAVTSDRNKDVCRADKIIEPVHLHENKNMELIDSLLSPEKQLEGTPYQLLKKKRKKRRRSPGL